jgi:hypothetical protein
LHEIVSAPLVAGGGAALSNGATVVVSLLALLVWFRIAQNTTSYPLLSTFCLAFSSLFWINSATTMDHVWSLLFLVLSLFSLHRNKSLTGGICLGIAIGFRFSNAIAIVPLLTIVAFGRRPLREAAIFVLMAAATATLAFAPLLLRYGVVDWIRMTRVETGVIHFSFLERIQFFMYRSVYSIGPLATVIAAALLAFHRKALLKRIRSRDALFIASLIGVTAFLSLFIIYPLERSYLLPAVCFLLIAIQSLATRNQFVVFGLCLISFGFVNPDIVKHVGAVGTPGYNIHWGTVVEEYQKRVALLDDRDNIPRICIPGRALVMTGSDAAFWFDNENLERDTLPQWNSIREKVVCKKGNADLCFVAALNRKEIEQARAMGYTVYCLASAREYVERVTGLRMADEHVSLVSPEHAG